METSAIDTDEHKASITALDKDDDIKTVTFTENIDSINTLTSPEDINGIKTLNSVEDMDDIKTLTSVENTRIYKTMNSIDLSSSSTAVDTHKYKTLTSWEAKIIILLFSANFFLFMCSIGYMGLGSSLLVLDQHLGTWEKYIGRKILNLGYINIVLGLLLCICTSIGYGIFTHRKQPVWIKFYMSVMLILLLLLLLGLIVYLVPAKEVEEEPGLWDKVKSKIPLKGRTKWNELKEGIKSKLKPKKYDDGKDVLRILKIIITIWVAVPLVVTLLIMVCSIVLSILLLRSQSTKDSKNAQVYVLYHKDSLLLKRS